MRYLLMSALCFLTVGSGGQSLLPTPRNIQAAYDKGTRSTSGSPGKNYWQNTADYDLDIHFSPSSRLLTGTARIRYSNNSPDTLKEIGFRFYPNLYKKGAPSRMTIKHRDLGEGMVIDQLLVNGVATDPSKLKMDNTVGSIPIDPLLKGGQVQFTISYHYELNKESHIRTGEIEPGADFVAYFFPRIAVYDDVDKWNKYPYNGSLEFYNDFCHFRAAITVPSGQVVWATGNLLNGKEVLSETTYRRLQAAEKNDSISTIIDKTEYETATDRRNPTNTWLFEATDVTDFVFACSDHYMWQSSSLVVDKTTGRRTRVDAVFNPKHKDYFNVASDARKTVEAMSYTFPAWPYPYPHETVFDGLDQMEYPMMVNDNPLEDRAESIELTDHEIFHTMFPFYMGINETKYAWMDEGWATIGEWLISPMIDSSLVDLYGVDPTSSNAGKETDLPIITLSTEISGAYFTNSYPKPAMGYLFIKDYLGDALFTKALHHYIEEWHGKHPLPNDFFYSMNAGAGKDLNWFWEKWFFDKGIPDLAIGSVKRSGQKFKVKIASIGTKPVPVDLIVHYTDGSKETFHRTIAAWEKGARSVTVDFTASKTVSELVLGGSHTPDASPGDNIYILE